jgi:hypothetical protein
MWHIVLETLNASEQVLLDIFGEQFLVSAGLSGRAV